MKPAKDIHSYNLKYERAKEYLSKVEISAKNKKMIEKFDEACQLEGLGIPRRLKLIGSLIIIVKDYLKKDFDKADKDDLKNTVLKLDSKEDYSPWTKHSYKSVIKKFYKWLVFGDDYKFKLEYPEIVNWIRVHVKRKEQPKVQASEILTEKEVEKLIDSAEHPRDKAFVAMLYELGARIGEIGTLRIGDISKDKYSLIVDLNGKTGHRTPRIVESVPFVTAWLNEHPFRNDPSTPLWVMIGDRNKNRRMEYQTFRAVVLRLAKKAKLKKRIYPHLFRHSRVTHLLTNKQINESQAKVYFGWTPSSNMLSEYSHLISQDVNNVILEIHGIKPTEEKKDPKVRQCPRCKILVRKDFLFCPSCSSPIDMQTVIKIDEQKAEIDQITKKLLSEDIELKELITKRIIEKGLSKELVKLYIKNKKNHS
ncbi:MAG: tyrosine-type recombinase/integrase [Elusimicrobiota bacterium]